MRDKRKYMNWLQRSMSSREKPWYEFKQQDGDKSPEIYLYDVIGDSWFEDSVSAGRFAKMLQEIGDVEELTVRINSPGGAVFDGLAIYNLLRDHPAQVHVKIDGIAASIAGVIAMAGDQVTMADNASLMIHKPWTVTVGHAIEHQETIDTLNFLESQTNKSFQNKGGDKVSDKDMELWNNGDDHWLDAETAERHGLVDTVNQSLPLAAFFTPDDCPYDNVPKAFVRKVSQETPHLDKLQDQLLELTSTEMLLDNRAD